MKASLKIKAGMMIAALTLASAAQATVLCGLQGENKKIENQFDRSIAAKQFATDGQTTYVVDKNADAAEEIDLGSLKTYEDWKRIDGKNVVFLGVHDGQASFYVGRVSLKDPKNMIQIHTSYTGGLAPSKPALLMMNKLNLAVVCTKN